MTDSEGSKLDPKQLLAEIDPNEVGVVVIGRNEGLRLKSCLQSLRRVSRTIYVDSGSTDDSVSLARSFGVDVLELSPESGFSAARARNAGIDCLVVKYPGMSLVQTLDGDCELREEWVPAAVKEMSDEPTLAVVFGRRREKHADANRYHRACDDEWNVPAGFVDSCGGDALFRVKAFRSVDGFNPSLIAGEEPDLCLRLRQGNWRIKSNGLEMTVHDIAMTSLHQWWLRAVRSGFAFTDLLMLHGRASNAAWLRLIASAYVWTGLICSGGILLACGIVSGRPLLTLLGSIAFVLLALQSFRLALTRISEMEGFSKAFQWGVLMLIAKPAQAYGSLKRWRTGLTRRPQKIIEYKNNS